MLRQLTRRASINFHPSNRSRKWLIARSCSSLKAIYQSAVHYVKGTEKMLKQLKDQLGRYKTDNGRLKTEVQELEDRPRD